MSNTWKKKVLPKFKKLFDKGKKKGAAEVCKIFDKHKESYDKEFEEKGPDLGPKVVEIYRSSETFIVKKLLKKPSEASVKENSAPVEGLLQDLVKAGFPGAQVVCEAGKKYGPAHLPGPIVYLFEKASVYLADEPLPEEPTEEKTRDVSAEDLKTADASAEPETSATATASEAEASAAAPTPEDEKKKDLVVEEVKEPAVTSSVSADADHAHTKETPEPITAEEPAATADDHPAPTEHVPAPVPAPAPTQ